MFKASISTAASGITQQTRTYATRVTRTMFPRHYRLRHKVNAENERPSPASVSSTSTTTPLSHPDLPPALVKGARPEFAKLTPEQIAEMQALRASDPAKYTRSVLAKKYNVSDMFVKCFVPASKQVQQARIKAQQRAFESKGWKAQEIVIQRQKRRELW
ncbi:hypothetical protein BGZ59_005816 [Podila verticillata]|nr:hypothetical protein BGZ59_005816 [Podila verticillata]